MTENLGIDRLQTKEEEMVAGQNGKKKDWNIQQQVFAGGHPPNY